MMQTGSGMSEDALRSIFALQRDASRSTPAPAFEQRSAALRKLRDLVRTNATALAGAISADFGGRSESETELLEIVPTLSTLRRCVATARTESSPQAPITRRMAAMLEFLEEMHGWYMQVMKLPPATLHSLMSIGSGITRILPKTKRRRLD